MKKWLSILTALIMILSIGCAAADPGFTLRNVQYDSATLAKAAIPDGYEMYTTVNMCDNETCLGYPIRVSVGALNMDTPSMLLYSRGESYLQRVKHSYFSHEEGTLDKELCIFMKEYMPAYNYTWYRAQEILKGMGFADVQLSGWQDDLTSFDQVTAARADYLRTEVMPGLQGAGFNIDWVDTTAAERAFTFDNNGVTWCVAVFAEGFGYKVSTGIYNTESIFWEIPRYYAMVCPKDLYQQIHDNDFRIFRENTGTNDEFDDFVDRLNFKIRDDVIRAWNMQVAASMAYMETMTALTFSMVEGTLGGTYHNTDRFSDYIFDQNDYTTLDGDHVKVSTAYDYVYQSGSNVYFTNDALSVPYGATMLTPN